MNDFVENEFPPIGPPLGATPAIVKVQHADVALTKVMQLIQNPPPNYPAINNLKSGSYICTVTQKWPHIIFEIILMKN